MLSWGDLIKICRVSKKMTQKELAEKVHTTCNTICLYETGKVVPRVDIFSDLIESCGYEIGIRERKSTYTIDEVMKIIEEKSERSE